MQNHDVLHSQQWKPFTGLGLHHDFWTLQVDTVISTTIVLCIIIAICTYAHYCFTRKKSIVRFIILSYVGAFKDLLMQTLQSVPANHLSFVASLFTFILLCNLSPIIPWLEEPTKDINTTLALGLVSFFYVQTYSIKANGLKGYFADFFEPFFLMFPLNVMGTCTSVVSLSFRLFGNIFGGYIISSLYQSMLSGSVVLQAIGLCSGMNLLMLFLFGVFEGVIQAFVFSMLTLTYLSMEILPDEEDNEPNIKVIP